MTEEKKAMKENKDKKIANKAKETQKKTKKIQNKARETEKKAKKANVTKGAPKKVLKVEKDKEIKKKAKEAEKKVQESKKRAQEEVRKRAREEEDKFREAEKRIREAEKKAREVEMTRVQEAEKKAREAEIKRDQEEKKKAKEVEIKTKKEMKIMEEEKKPMEDEKKAKEVKVKTKKEESNPMEEQSNPMEEQRTTMESPADFSPPKNNSGRSAIFISLIALAVAFFNFFTPASAPTQNVDLGGIQDNIDAVSSSVKKMNSKITENRHLLDSQIASSAEKFDRQKAETDKMYLTSGFSEMVKGMQPSLGIYCKRASVSYIKLSKTAKTGTNTVAVDCNFDNKGTLKANIVPGSLIMLGGKGQQVIDNAVERIDNGEATTILPGRSSGKQYHVVLTEAGAANMKGGVLKMTFQSYTDIAALAMIKRKTHKEISGEQLKELTATNHMFSFLL
jgi:hypothetical protein